jgi:hypothetical protein
MEDKIRNYEMPWFIWKNKKANLSSGNYPTGETRG